METGSIRCLPSMTSPRRSRPTQPRGAGREATGVSAARHPVIRTHPETGQRTIYTNRSFVREIEGCTPEESAKSSVTSSVRS